MQGASMRTIHLLRKGLAARPALGAALCLGWLCLSLSNWRVAVFWLLGLALAAGLGGLLGRRARAQVRSTRHR
jgi:hypothetical protein